MKAQDPHAQETVIYDDLTLGNHADIEALRAAAHAADPTPPEPAPEGWLPPIDQFELDYANAWARYQADNEAPEDEREANTAEAVDAENDAASAAQVGEHAGAPLVER